MTRRFYMLMVMALAGLLAVQIPAHAADLVKSAVLESNVAYLRVGQVTKNLADEVGAALGALAVSNRIAGTVLDLRMAGGDSTLAAKAATELFSQKKTPLAILVNNQTRGAAAKLAADLREARAGLIFGSSTEVKPDIAVAVNASDEKQFLENPYAAPAQTETNLPPATNNLLPIVDHTSEADLVRGKIKDGEADESIAPPKPEPPKPSLRDSVLARAVDLIKGLAIVRHQS